MAAVPFDTLKLADRLNGGGFTQEQAKTAAKALAEAMPGVEPVTKEHLDLRLSDLEQKLTIRLGGMLVVAVGGLFAALRYIPPAHF